MSGAFALCFVASPAFASFPGTNGDIIFDTGNGVDELRLMDLNGQDLGVLTSTQNGSFLPEWSADGSRLLFNDITDPNSANNPPPQLFSINEDGSSYYQLTDSPEGGEKGTWSPDSLRIAYTSRYGNSLKVMDADGSNAHDILTGGYFLNSFFYDPSWSPDGSTILYTKGAITFGHDDGIYAINPDGTNARKLSSIGQAPSWSPDGQSIYFHSNTETGDYCEIYRMNKDGSGVTRLTTTANISECRPKVAPDGSAIFYFDSISGRIRKLALPGMTDTQISAPFINMKGFDIQPIAAPLVYRMANFKTHERLFTTNVDEAFYARNNLEGWVLEGAGFKSTFASTPNSTEVYRLANFITHERLFTTSAYERDFAISHYAGWVSEGTAFHAAACGAGTTSVFRLANFISRERLFTTNTVEVTNAVQHIPGWVSEGVAFCTPN